MVKTLHKAPAQLRLTIKCISTVGRREFISTETGTNSTFDIFNQLNNNRKDFILGAIYNAIYKHIRKGGNSSALTEILDYDIEYKHSLVTINKVKYGDKFYSVVRDNNTKKVIGRTKWRQNSNDYLNI